jgi:hypothetical protein
MKKLLCFLGCLLAFQVAVAEVYRCEVEDQQYLLALTDSEGILYSGKTGYFKEMEGSMVVFRAMDGGPIVTIFTPMKEDIDWSSSERCWVFGQPVLSFEINRSHRGNRGSKLQVLPNIESDPATLCSIPRPAVAPAQNMKCELLK